MSPDYLVCSIDRSVHPEFLHHLLRSAHLVSEFGRRSKGIRPAQWRLYWEDLAEISIPLPPVDEQRRIADFLDAETARIDSVASMRSRQLALMEQRFAQIVDGVVVGDRDSLREIGYDPDIKWERGKVSRLFAVIPGYAFPSAGFVAPEAGVPLLRGINVAPGFIDWNAETVAWDLQASSIDQRFHLRCDDLVIGMDRTWISGGARIALVCENDLPCLLLQRVACIRSYGRASTHYLRWVLGSRHFRRALEGETTGISVPHISGEQIGSFNYMLPLPEHERMLVALLERQDGLRAEYSVTVNRQHNLLAERRQALITSAVTGQLDVTTARPTENHDF
ncbi:restriction endonuclease subunit S [Streptomyces rubiginosohelvolus]|uniref:restriction endonuclease subunit S n=1 Tax=Streptomyces rubiginosohelvolus TaxID=67362 RepID=UPI0036DD89F1